MVNAMISGTRTGISDLSPLCLDIYLRIRGVCGPENFLEVGRTDSCMMMSLTIYDDFAFLGIWDRKGLGGMSVRYFYSDGVGHLAPEYIE